jgi:hypothetical protein
LNDNKHSQPGSSSEQPTQPMKSLKKKASVWIRPHDDSLELPYYTSLPFRFRWQNVVRIILDLLGVGVLVGAVLLAIRLQGTVESTCPSAQMCNAQGIPYLSPTVPGHAHNTSTPYPTSTLTQAVTAVPEPTPRPSPTDIPGPTSTPGPTATPTAVAGALTAIPRLLRISLSLVCLLNLPTTLKLVNTSNMAILWWVDKSATSPSLRVVVPSQNYLIQPDTRVSIDLYCTNVNGIGNYALQLLYSNGGSLRIPVIIIA